MLGVALASLLINPLHTPTPSAALFKANAYRGPLDPRALWARPLARLAEECAAACKPGPSF